MLNSKIERIPLLIPTNNITTKFCLTSTWLKMCKQQQVWKLINTDQTFIYAKCMGWLQGLHEESVSCTCDSSRLEAQFSFSKRSVLCECVTYIDNVANWQSSSNDDSIAAILNLVLSIFTHIYVQLYLLLIFACASTVCWVPFFCVNIVAAFCKTCIGGQTFKILSWLGELDDDDGDGWDKLMMQHNSISESEIKF